MDDRTQELLAALRINIDLGLSVFDTLDLVAGYDMARLRLRIARDLLREIDRANDVGTKPRKPVPVCLVRCECPANLYNPSEGTQLERGETGRLPADFVGRNLQRVEEQRSSVNDAVKRLAG